MGKHDQDLYLATSYAVAEQITKAYSTSFTRAVKQLAPKRRSAIYAIYAMVRVADEIVDAGFAINKASALDAFESEVFQAIEQSYSANPVLHAFQAVANIYHIPRDLIEAFFASMRMDLTATELNSEDFATYVYGSAEVVGLMCLNVFCEGDEVLAAQLRIPAQQLGSAFQKINFLRDLGADYRERGRSYFPNVDLTTFTDTTKGELIADCTAELDAAAQAVGQLPSDVSRAIRIAIAYYRELLVVIGRTPAAQLLTKRVRVSDAKKVLLAVREKARSR